MVIYTGHSRWKLSVLLISLVSLPKDPIFLYSLNTSVCSPPTLYQFNLSNGRYTIFQTQTQFTILQIIETKQVFFNSKDGTKSSNVYYLHKELY